MSTVLLAHANDTALAERSPFLPPGFTPPRNAPTAANRATQGPSRDTRQLQFKGVYQLGGQYFFNIFDQRENKGSWVGLREGGADFLVTEFDESSGEIELDVDGIPLSLSLATPSDNPIPVQTGRPATAANVRPAAPVRPQRPTTVNRRRVVPPRPPNVAGAQNNAPAQRNRTPPRRRIVPPPPPPSAPSGS